MSKELVIDKNTKLDKIENKEEYTKLVIEYKVKPEKLAGFTNVKELVIDGLFMEEYNINERNLDIFPIKNNIEKIVFKNIETCGKCYKGFRPYKVPHYYYLTYPNLKSVEFPYEIRYINSQYLSYLENLEEIVYNSNDFLYKNNIQVNTLNLKRLIIKIFDKKYTIDLDYKVNNITSIIFDKYNKNITVEFNNEGVHSKATIKTLNDEIECKNQLVLSRFFIEDGLYFIPDYITDVREFSGHDISEISLNLNLLKSIKSLNRIIHYNKDNRKVEKFILRNSNDMQLMPEKVINVKEYGDLERFYIEDNLLKLIYKAFDLFIDSKGNIEKIDKNIEEEIDGTIKEIDLNKLTEKELKKYMAYKELLELVKEYDIEYKKALEVVEDRVVKRLEKRR